MRKEIKIKEERKGEGMREKLEIIKHAAEIATGRKVVSVEFLTQAGMWLKYKINFEEPYRFTRGDMNRIKQNLRSHKISCFVNKPNTIGILA